MKTQARRGEGRDRVRPADRRSANQQAKLSGGIFPRPWAVAPKTLPRFELCFGGQADIQGIERLRRQNRVAELGWRAEALRTLARVAARDNAQRLPITTGVARRERTQPRQLVETEIVVNVAWPPAIIKTGPPVCPINAMIRVLDVERGGRVARLLSDRAAVGEYVTSIIERACGEAVEGGKHENRQPELITLPGRALPRPALSPNSVLLRNELVE